MVCPSICHWNFLPLYVRMNACRQVSRTRRRESLNHALTHSLTHSPTLTTCSLNASPTATLTPQIHAHTPARPSVLPSTKWLLNENRVGVLVPQHRSRGGGDQLPARWWGTSSWPHRQVLHRADGEANQRQSHDLLRLAAQRWVCSVRAVCKVKKGSEGSEESQQSE